MLPTCPLHLAEKESEAHGCPRVPGAQAGLRQSPGPPSLACSPLHLVFSETQSPQAPPHHAAERDAADLGPGGDTAELASDCPSSPGPFR